MIKRILITTLLTSFVLLFGTNAAFAVSIPNFPSCLNPQGTLKASYNEGTHGIPGDTSTYTGKDTVYQIDENTLTQCFCATDGKGIQTNWWRASSLTEEDIQVLKSDNWTYIPNGTLWGLNEGAYMTKNLSYSCLGGSTGTQGNSNGGSGGNDGGDGLGCAVRDCSNQGQILAAATTNMGNILGLATTGGTYTPYALGLTGLLAIASGIYLNKTSLLLRNRKVTKK